MLTVKLMNKLNKKEIASAIKQVVDNVSDQIIVLQRTIKKQTKKIEKLQAALAKKE
jgi:flagellar biosynthesis chaperone FliJ